MSPTSHPYRACEPFLPDPHERRTDPAESALAAAELFILAWSTLRLAACMVHGLDVEGCFALVVVLLAVIVLTSPRPKRRVC